MYYLLVYCVFVLIFFVLCALCCQFLWIVHFRLPLRYLLHQERQDKSCLSKVHLLVETFNHTNEVIRYEIKDQ